MRATTFAMASLVAFLYVDTAFPASSAAALNGTTDSEPYNLAVKNYRERPVQQIVGGSAAQQDEFPWQVSLGASNIPDPHWAHFCGGVIYRPYWVVTAAHCVVGLMEGDISVAAGVLKLAPGITRYPIDRDPIIKPGYKKGGHDNDVALLHLASAIPTSQSVQAIDLISDSTEASFVDKTTMLTASGWGSMEPVGLAVDSLRKLDLPYVSTRECTKSLSYPPDPKTNRSQITGQMLCAGYPGGGADTCQGDSGGPLIFKDSGIPKLVGISSWGGYPCAHAYKYGIYARLSQYRSWLEKTVAP